MPSRYDYFKTIFSSTNNNKKLFERRKEKVLLDIHALAACQDAWRGQSDAEADVGGSVFSVDHWDALTATIREETATSADLRTCLTLLENKAQTRPGEAYRDLGTFKEEVRSHLSTIQQCMASIGVKDIIMITILEVDLLRVVSEEVNPQYPLRNTLSGDVQVEVSVPSSIFAEFEVDFGNYTLIREAISNSFAEYRTRCARALSEWNILKEEDPFETSADTQAKWVAFRTLMTEAPNSLTTTLTAVANESYNNWVERRRRYKEFNIGLRCKATVAVVGIAGGIAGLATSPFSFGATAVVGIVGIVSSFVTLCETLGTLNSSAMQAWGNARDKTQAIVTKFADSSYAWNTAREVSAEMLGVFGGSNFGQGLGAAKSAVNAADQKWTPLDAANRDAMKDIPRLIGLIENLKSGRNNSEEYTAYCAAHNIDQEADFQRLEDQLNNLLNSVANARQEIEDMYRKVEGLQNQLTLLDPLLNQGVVTTTHYLALMAKISISIGVGAADAAPDWDDMGKRATTIIGSINTILAEVDNELADKLIGG